MTTSPVRLHCCSALTCLQAEVTSAKNTRNVARWTLQEAALQHSQPAGKNDGAKHPPRLKTKTPAPVARVPPPLQARRPSRLRAVAPRASHNHGRAIKTRPQGPEAATPHRLRRPGHPRRLTKPAPRPPATGRLPPPVRRTGPRPRWRRLRRPPPQGWTNTAAARVLPRRDCPFRPNRCCRCRRFLLPPRAEGQQGILPLAGPRARRPRVFQRGARRTAPRAGRCGPP